MTLARCSPLEIILAEQQAQALLAWSWTAFGCALALLAVAGALVVLGCEHGVRLSQWRMTLAATTALAAVGAFLVSYWDWAHRFGYHNCGIFNRQPVIPYERSIMIAQASGWMMVAATALLLLVAGVIWVRSPRRQHTDAAGEAVGDEG